MEGNSVPANQQRTILSRGAGGAQQSMKGLANLVERIEPWLITFGIWIFGGLIASSLVVISALLTIRPTDAAILISIAALACALPFNVAGIFLLRLVKDANDMGIDDLALRAFQDAGFPGMEAYFPIVSERQRQQKRRSRVALCSCAGLAALGSVFTLAGFVAALWHMAWWLGVVLVATVVLSTILTLVVLAYSLPPESEAEKELKRRYMEHRAKLRSRTGQEHPKQ